MIKLWDEVWDEEKKKNATRAHYEQLANDASVERLVAERDALREQNARLIEALEHACRYLDKCEADGLLQGCAIRPQTAALQFRALLAAVGNTPA